MIVTHRCTAAGQHPNLLIAGYAAVGPTPINSRGAKVSAG